MTQPNLLEIDGSFGEGGGQILRTAVGLAAAVWSQQGAAARRGLFIRNVRANRPKGGLRPQHLAAVNAAAQVCGGSCQGAALDSTTLVFCPGKPRAGNYRFDIGTAGASMLVLQTILPALVLADGDSQVEIAGGTHNPMAPCFEYVRDVFGTLASAANAAVGLTLEQMGFYPAGGGLVRCRVRGLAGRENLAPLVLLSRGQLKYIEGVSAASESLPDHIVQRQCNQVIGRLRMAGLKGSLEQRRSRTASPGTVVFLRAVFSRSVAGFFALGKLGKPAEKVADEAVDQLLEFLAADGAVDPHAADQLITLLALSPGRSELTTTRVTNHLLTNAQVIRLVAGRTVTVEGAPGKPGRVSLERIDD